jgi:2-dehydro-3-deoxygluconokinase
MDTSGTIAAIGNVYVETNFLGLVTAGADSLVVGKEYRAPSYEVRLGGSVANFAVQLTRLGGFRVAVVGKIGRDEMGKELKSLLSGAGIETDLIRVSSDQTVQTSVDSGLVLGHSGQNIQVVGGNSNQKLSLSDIDLDSPYFSSVSAVYLGGFMKQESLYADYPLLVKRLCDRKIKVFLDHGRIPVDVTEDKKRVLTAALPYVTGYLPNETELLSVSGTHDMSSAMRWTTDMGVGFVAVKLGERGCKTFDGHRESAESGYPVTPVSTVGAGDAFNAGFISHYLSGHELSECARFANATAALRVATNRHPTVDEVTGFLASPPAAVT